MSTGRASPQEAANSPVRAQGQERGRGTRRALPHAARCRKPACHRRPRRVPLSAGSPVPRDPPAGAEAVLRASCRGPRARVVKALADGGAPECREPLR